MCAMVDTGELRGHSSLSYLTFPRLLVSRFLKWWDRTKIVIHILYQLPSNIVWFCSKD